MKKHFVLIITSQRSGSTLFCQDLNSIGIGRPGEHAMTLLRNKEIIPSLDELYEKCRFQTSQGDIYALKTMVSNTHKIVRAVYPDLKGFEAFNGCEDQASILNLMVEVLERDFEVVVPFILTRRNVVDVALSRSLAQESKVYLSRSVKGDEHDMLDEDAVVDRFFRNVGRAQWEKSVLERLSTKLGERALCFDYEDLVGNEGALFQDVKDHLARHGLYPEKDAFVRNRIKKVTSKSTSRKYKSIIKEELDRLSRDCGEAQAEKMRSTLGLSKLLQGRLAGRRNSR